MAIDLPTLREQLRQLQALHAAQVLGDEAYQQASAPLERRIVELVMAGAADTPVPTAAEAPMAPTPRGAKRLWAGVATGVLVVAAAGYWWTGSPQLATRPMSTSMAGEDNAGAPKDAPHELGSDQIARMVEKLEQRLKASPSDAEGWAMLARSYAVLGRHADALPAYKQALALRHDDATLLADYADALAVSQQGVLKGEPLNLVQQALKLDPANLKALSLAGTAAFDAKDYALAVKHWERIVAVAPPDSSYLQQVQANLAEARELGHLPQPAAALGAVPSTEAGAPPVAAVTAPAPAGGATVSGTVSLAPSLLAKTAPTDTVFVFARAAQGPRMPLAILRKQVKDLPFDFKLDDSTAMSPAMRLSAYPSVVIGARVSKSGDAMPQAGDLTGQTDAVALGANGLKINISQVVSQ